MTGAGRMEEKKSVLPHSVAWKDRKKGSITGVTDVHSFDENLVVLETTQGVLTLKGKHLHVSRLMLEQGEVDLEGTVDSMVYSGKRPEAKGSLLRRMLR